MNILILGGSNNTDLIQRMLEKISAKGKVTFVGYGLNRGKVPKVYDVHKKAREHPFLIFLDKDNRQLFKRNKKRKNQ